MGIVILHSLINVAISMKRVEHTMPCYDRRWSVIKLDSEQKWPMCVKPAAAAMDSFSIIDNVPQEEFLSGIGCVLQLTNL